jgi:hypothetical protein
MGFTHCRGFLFYYVSGRRPERGISIANTPFRMHALHPPQAFFVLRYHLRNTCHHFTAQISALSNQHIKRLHQHQGRGRNGKIVALWVSIGTSG